MDCLVRISARQKFDGDVGASTRTFNDAMVRTNQFRRSISGRMKLRDARVRLLPMTPIKMLMSMSIGMKKN